MKLVLDTSAYSQLRRGHTGVLDQLSAAEFIYVPTVVLGELRAGFELGSRTRDNVALLDEFLDEPFVDVVDVDASIATHYARLFARLRRSGTPIPINDVWIAACALGIGLPLLTFDRDFSRIDELDARILEA